ncbi:MAG: FHA domain-containing protein [Myxococcales bacterium]|nr:FHA domain-containing protein [Myxococcales bacterium]
MNAALTSSPSAPHRLRVLDGPLQGTIHAIRGRFCIGRSGTADLQLLDDRVSREHAEIVAGPADTYWLVDLGSSNGTFIDGQRVDRALLALDTTFRIGRTTFAFEREVITDASDETLVVSYQGVPCQRGTVEFSVVESIRARADERGAGPRGQQIVATYSNGKPYPGNAVEDIARFHTLQLRKVRAGLQHAEDRELLETLDERLSLPTRPSDTGSLSPLYVRLTCSVPATVRLPSGESLSVTTTEFGVDGAQVSINDHRLVRGHPAWLTIELLTGKRLRTVVFTTQVTWNSSDQVGLSFSSHRCWRNVADPWQQAVGTRKSHRSSTMLRPLRPLRSSAMPEVPDPSPPR